jgi:hypothetical protein
MKAGSRFTEKNTMLVREFDKYILEHPAFADRIPDGALVIMQIEGDEKFNKWARQAARKAANKSNPRVYVTVTELKPVRSRIGKLKVELAA